MILYCDDNAGVLFHKWTIGGAIKEYISGTINTFSTVAGFMKGHGLLGGTANGSSVVSGYWKAYARMTGVINTASTVTAKWIAYAKISGVINTFTRVTGGLNTLVVVEYIRIKSTVTRILKINSKL